MYTHYIMSVVIYKKKLILKNGIDPSSTKSFILLTCSVSNLAITSNRTWQGVQKFTTGVQCMSRSFPALHWHNSHRTNSSKSGYLGPCLVFVFESCILRKIYFKIPFCNMNDFIDRNHQFKIRI